MYRLIDFFKKYCCSFLTFLTRFVVKTLSVGSNIFDLKVLDANWKWRSVISRLKKILSTRSYYKSGQSWKFEIDLLIIKMINLSIGSTFFCLSIDRSLNIKDHVDQGSNRSIIMINWSNMPSVVKVTIGMGDRRSWKFEINFWC